MISISLCSKTSELRVIGDEPKYGIFEGISNIILILRSFVYLFYVN